MRAATRGITRIAALALAAMLCACAGLPPRGPVAVTHADINTGHTSLARTAAASRPADETAPSGFRLLPAPDYAFMARIALAERAQVSLDAQYYHIHADTAGATFLRVLRDAAQRGVRVRLLVDDYYAADIYELLIGLAAHPNADVRLFNPLPARMGSPLVRLALSFPEFERVNHRMHNKLLVADNAIAVYGGRNIADEYFQVNAQANFIDLDVLSTGQVVRDLSNAFDTYWNSEFVYPLHPLLPAPADPAAARAAFERHTAGMRLSLELPSADPLGVSPVAQQLDQGRLSLTFGSARVFADPPSKVTDPVLPDRPSAAMRGQHEVIASATSEILIVNPYLVPGEIGLRMMNEAKRRGVRAVIFTNSLGSTDEPLAHFFYARQRERILKAGVELFELSPSLAQHTGAFGNFGKSLARLHAKGGVVDQRWLLVGSVNLDARSATLNTELCVAIDSPPLAAAAMNLIAGEQYRSMYRLQLAPHGRGVQWVYTDAQGRTRVSDDEPDFDRWLWMKLWLQSVFVGEGQL